MKVEWPLWECLDTRALVELAQYQWLNYGTKLDILAGAQQYSEQFFIESLAEIARIVKQPPRHQKRVV